MIIDRGASPKSATTNMEVYIDDVNDESPFFNKRSFKANILEDTGLGIEIVQCDAFDKDLDSFLLFNITGFEAYDENGEDVEIDKVKVWLLSAHTFCLCLSLCLSIITILLCLFSQVFFFLYII